MDDIFKKLVEGMVKGRFDKIENILNDENLENELKEGLAEFWSNRKEIPLSGSENKAKLPSLQETNHPPLVEETEAILYDLQSIGIDSILFPIDHPEMGDPENADKSICIVVCFESKNANNKEKDFLTKQFTNYQMIKMKPIQMVNNLELNELNINEIPQDISRLINLKFLDLRDNRIKKIPQEIGNLAKLISLRLDNNQISEIPNEIQFLQNLEDFSVSDNSLKEINSAIFQLPNLKYISIMNNSVTQIPQEIKNLKLLRGLTLDFNKIENLPEELLELEYINYLSVWYNPLNDKSIDVLSQLINQNPNIYLNWGQGLDQEFLESVKYERSKAA